MNAIYRANNVLQSQIHLPLQSISPAAAVHASPTQGLNAGKQKSCLETQTTQGDRPISHEIDCENENREAESISPEIKRTIMIDKTKNLRYYY